ncbi:MAG: serine/threonine protein kinase [Anaerolineae bacterium]|nr:serine/threonine protein kinase [Anaerolineae bacterium]
MSSLSGRKLGQYEIIDLLDKGGMGTVYKGYQPSVDRFVAIKVLPPHPGMDAQYLQRFQLEARTIGSLQHPHILPLYDYGSEEGIVYLVMAFADGGSLNELVERAPVAPELIDRLLRAIAGALDYAHRRGIVHRDIKPGNILLDSEGHALLADFGIVKMLNSGSNLTGTGIIGTPAYMSPEQAQGTDVDGRTDIYALGVMVYELLTGRQPFTGETPLQVLLKHIGDPVPDVCAANPALPAALGPVLRQALAKNPQERYQTAADFAAAFSAAVSPLSATGTLRPAETGTATGTGLASAAAIPETVKLSPVTATPTPTSAAPATIAPAATTTKTPTPPAPAATVNALLVGSVGLLLLALVLAGALIVGLGAPAVTATPPATDAAAAAPTRPAIVSDPGAGELRFTSVNAPGDGLTLRLNGLVDPPAGSRYAAWLVNTGSATTLPLGDIVKDAFGDGTLLYTDPDGRMLPAWYNAVLVTVESGPGPTPAAQPAGTPVYSGSVPLSVTDSLQQIFVAAPQGINGGSLIDGVRTEANFALQHSGLAARATTLGGLKQHAEHTINILRGTQDDLDGNRRGENPGRGPGVYGFLADIEALVQAAATSPEASLDVQSNAEFIQVCIRNVRGWADDVQALENELLAAQTLEEVAAQAQESTRHMETTINGLDANENGQIEPFEGECGLAQIPEYGVLFGNMIVREGGLNAR